MKEYEFWRERATGEIWAIQLSDGAVSGCCGPLQRSEVDESFLDALDYAPDRAGWVDAHRDAFDLCDPTLI